MQLRAEALEPHLAKSFAPIYTIHGDEPLLALEAADALRAASRARGFAEREAFEPGPHFDWSAFLHAAASRSLFSGKKRIELRLPTGRPGSAGAAAIERYCANPDADNLLLVMLPRLDRRTQASAWFRALAGGGVVVEVRPVERAALAAWIGARLARHGLRASAEALEFLADRVEGNLLAAHQEIEKLALVLPRGELALEDIEPAVANVARYDLDALAEALCAGDLARYARALAGLREEGESCAALAWMLGEELLAIARVKAGLAAGRDKEALFAENRIWRSRQRRAEAALKRASLEKLRAAVAQVALAERAAKGVAGGEPWDRLLELGLKFAHGSKA